MLGLVVYGAIVQRIGHRPSKSTMLVRFQLALPENDIDILSISFSVLIPPAGSEPLPLGSGSQAVGGE